MRYASHACVCFDAVKMLGRKQSLRGEVILADYGPDESFSESTDIEWVNKVSASEAVKSVTDHKTGLGPSILALLCAAFSGLCVSQHSVNLQQMCIPHLHHVHLRLYGHRFLHRRNDGQNPHQEHLQLRSRSLVAI